MGFIFWTALLALPLLRDGMLADLSFGVHLRTGAWILANGAWPRRDVLSFTQADAPWLAWSWLFDLLAACSERLLGLAGPVLLTILGVATFLGLLTGLLQRRTGDGLATWMLLQATAVLASGQVLLRPHVAAWVLVLLTYAVLDGHQRTGRARRLGWLPVLAVIWSNLHPSFMLGGALCLVYGVADLWTWRSAAGGEAEAEAEADASVGTGTGPRTGSGTNSGMGVAALGSIATGGSLGGRSICYSAAAAAARRRIPQLLGATVAAALASLVNPYGWRLHAQVLTFLADAPAIDRISEYASPDFHSPEGLVLLALLFATAARLRLRLRPVDVLVAGLAAALALYAQRHAPYAAALLALTLAPAWPAALARLPGPLSRALASRRRLSLAATPRLPLAAGATVGLLVLLAWRGGLAPSAPPLEAAIDPLRTMVGQGLTLDAWNGYLLYRLAPGYRSFMDDRFEFFTADLRADYLALVEAQRRAPELLQRYNLRWVLLPLDNPLVTFLRARADWQLAFEDSGVALLQRRAEPPVATVP